MAPNALLYALAKLSRRNFMNQGALRATRASFRMKKKTCTPLCVGPDSFHGLDKLLSLLEGCKLQCSRKPVNKKYTLKALASPEKNKNNKSTCAVICHKKQKMYRD